MEKTIYYSRIADKLLNLKLRAFGATSIVGPKWCGKTMTASQQAKSKILLQKDIDKPPRRRSRRPIRSPCSSCCWRCP